MRFGLYFFICVLLLLPCVSHGATWLVRKDGSGDCITIQACCDSAANGDTVLVGPGVYSEEVTFNNKSDFVLKAESDVTQTVLQNEFFFSVITCYNMTGESVIEGFTFAHCGSNAGAGAINCSNSSLTISGNVFFDCGSSDLEGNGGAGGAIAMLGSSGEIRGNTIYNCVVGIGGVGGGIYLSNSPNVVIDRNIIAGCVGEGIYSIDYVPVISCNDVWNNSPTNYGGVIPDQTGTNGNISVDPLFCDIPLEDFTLHADSPCLSAPGCGLIGALGQGCPTTSVEEQPMTWGKIKALFR